MWKVLKWFILVNILLLTQNGVFSVYGERTDISEYYDEHDTQSHDADEYNTYDEYESETATNEENHIQRKMQSKEFQDNNIKSIKIEQDQNNDRTRKIRPTPIANTHTITSTYIIESCPRECSCLNNFVDCIRQNLSTIPHIPKWVDFLELSHNDLNDVHCEENIRNLADLVKLHLNENKLLRIPVFVGLQSLERLVIANNQIREISSNALLALPQLNHLDLSRNFIHTISPNTFPKKNFLEKLILNHNEINLLSTGSFTNLKKLKKLSLNGNELRNSLQYATFSNLTALTCLKLRNNFIKDLITGIFHGLDNLNILDLANNELTEIHKGGLLNITLLSKLTLSNNSIHSIGKNCWEFTQKIKHLDMSLNQLTDITHGTFEMLSKLQTLDLHGNRISTIPPGAFNATLNLQSLNLSQNRISWTIEDTFGPFSSLQKLIEFDLNDNHIKTINKNAFLGLESLSHLDLRQNNITTIHNGAFDVRTTPALNRLQMNSSVLICDCNLYWFYDWVKSNLQATRFADVDKDNTKMDIRCAYPAILRGKRVLQLHKDNFTCHDTPKPRIIDEPKPQIVAIKGTNLTLECTAVLTVGSNILFKWKHDNIDIDDKFIETKLRKKDGNRLRLKERLIERRRKANRSPIRINVSAPKVPLISSSVSKLKYNNDDDEDDDDDNDDDDDDDDLENDDEDQENDGNTALETEEDIEASIPLNSTIATSIVNLNNIDHSHAGRYQCIASNTFGTTYSQRFKITVASFPVFTKRPSNITVQAKKNIRLDCAVDGDPKPNMYWQFNFGDDFPAARERRMHVMPGDDTFFISDAKLSDQGIYTCTAQNTAGIIGANATVVILEPPTLARPMENKDVIIGESSVVECKKSGTPIPQIRWYKDGDLIMPSDRHYFTQEDQLLIIFKTTEKDAGIYKCEMENSLGKISASMKLTVRSVISAANEISDGYSNGINNHERTAIVIVTVVCCAIGTSIIWVVIIYQTKKEGGCTAANNNGDTNGDNRINSLGHSFDKDNNILMAANVLMIPKGNGPNNQLQQPMRTATISNSHGVIRSSSGSSCGLSSIGVSDDIFRHYKDDCSSGNIPLHLPNRNGTESEEDEPNNDHEALLGTAYYGINGIKYPKVGVSPNIQKEKDSFIVQIHEGVDSEISQIDGGIGNNATAECIDDDQPSPLKTKTSMSLSSSCQSIPPLPYNSSHEFDSPNQYNGSVSSNVSVTPPLAKITNDNENGIKLCATDKSKLTPIKPVIPPVPIARTKPIIQTNKLNELMATFKK